MNPILKYLIIGIIGGVVLVVIATVVERVFGISYWPTWILLYAVYVIGSSIYCFKKRK